MASLFVETGLDANVPEIVAAASILTDLEEQHAQTKTKYQVLYYVLAKAPLPTGEQLWDDFSLLIRLRNELVHPKPENVKNIPRVEGRTGSVRKIIQALRSKKLIYSDNDFVPNDWSFALERDDEVAHWALRTAKLMIHTVSSQAPPSKSRCDGNFSNRVAYAEAQISIPGTAPSRRKNAHASP